MTGARFGVAGKRLSPHQVQNARESKVKGSHRHCIHTTVTTYEWPNVESHFVDQQILLRNSKGLRLRLSANVYIKVFFKIVFYIYVNKMVLSR